ncbi:MAG: hypothetical protein RSD27_02370 [Ruthenibacterium sp.]
MLGTVMLIMVTLFAVLGAYYLSDLFTAHVFRPKRARRVVILAATDCIEDLWNNVLDLRTRLPHTVILVLCKEGTPTCQRLEASLRDVVFATPQTVGAVVCEQLMEGCAQGM